MPIDCKERTYWTVWEAARRFRVTTQTVRNWIVDQKVLPAIRVKANRQGTKYLFLIPLSSIHRMVKARRRKRSRKH